MRNERSKAGSYRTIRLAVAMALGVLAIFALPSIAAAKDRNNDRIPDRWEKRHHLSLHVKQTRRDQDSDHLRNLGEFRHGTNPRRADSDGDGINDGHEAAVGDDPADDDSDNDGVDDGDENAGTVGAFDGTTLTINLAAGGTVSGMVTDRTEIKCEREDDDSGEDPSGSSRSGHHRRGSGHQGGEDHSGDDDSGHEGGDDHGGHHGEDHGGHHGEHGDDEECSVEELAEGAVVHEATIRVNGDGAVFKEIELIKSSEDSAG